MESGYDYTAELLGTTPPPSGTTTSRKRNEYVTIAVELQFKQLQSSPKKSISGL